MAAAGEEAREALGRAHRHRTNLRGWPATAAEAALRAARASSVLDGGGSSAVSSAVRQPRPRAGGRAAGVGGAWKAARRRWSACGSGPRCRPSRDCTHWPRPTWPTTTGSGRPRGDADVGRRLALLADIVTGGHEVPAPVLAAVAHGELLTLAPFGTADGVVARAVSRLVTIASGLDPHGLGVPEVYLDAALGRLPGRGTRILVGHTRRPCGVACAECHAPCTPARERRCRSRRRVVEIASQQSEAGDAPN